MSKERAALLHSYLADRENAEKPDRLTRIGILAASELYRRGEIDKICVTVKEELSKPQIRRLKTLLASPPEEDLVVDASTVTTKGEVGTFAKLAEENDWGGLITIGNDAHLPRIKKEIEDTFGKRRVEAKSSREILSRHSRYSSILADMNEWPEQKSLAFQEKVLNLPVLGKLVLKTAPRLSPLKVALQFWFFRKIEGK